MPHAGLHLFLGPDRPWKLQRLQELERGLRVQPLDRHAVDGASVTAPALLALCRQQPVASPVRLIVVDQAHKLNAACADGLQAHAEGIAAVACVVLLIESELSVRHPLARVRAVVTERFPGRESPAAKPFAFTDALGRGDAAGALAAAADQLTAGKEPLELLGLMAWQVNRWVTVKRLEAMGYSAERLGQVLSLRPWQVQRLQAEVGCWSLHGLQTLLERCWTLDVEAKRGRVIPQLAVETLVAEACLPRP